MIRFLVHRPVAVVVSFVALSLLGLAAARLIPTSLLPDTDVPGIRVRIRAGDLSAREIEQRITAPSREALQQIRGLEAVESTSGDGLASLQLDFSYGTNMSLAFIAVNEKLDMVMAQLPREVERPEVTRLSIADIPVFHLHIRDAEGDESAQRMAAMSSFAREVIRRRLEQVPEISMVDMSGYTQPQVQLMPRKNYLIALKLDQAMLVQVFNENKLEIGSVMVQDGHYRFSLRIASSLADIESISNIPVNVSGRLFTLGQLVDIRLGTAPVFGEFYVGGRRAIDLAVIKQSASKMEDLQTAFTSTVKALRNDYPDLIFEVAQDQTALLDHTVGNLQQNLLLGGLLAFMGMLVFIRQLRSAILVGITIPVTLIISLLGFFLFGVSVNVISLVGLILGLGMIFDNSIVVIDTITMRQRVYEEDRSEAAVKGTCEVVVPLISSVLTNCAVFVPLILISGLASAIFYDQALSVIIGVAVSLLVSVILLPPLFLLVHRIRPFKTRTRAIPTYVDVTGMYERSLRWVFRHRMAIFGIATALVAAGMYCFTRLGRERLPPISRTALELAIDWNAYMDLKESRQRVEDLLRNQRGIANYSYWLGEQQYLLSDLREMGRSEARVFIRAESAADMERLSKGLQQDITCLYPQVLIKTTPARNAFDEVFSEREAPLRLLVSAADRRSMPKVEEVRTLIDKLHQIPGIVVPAASLQRRLVLRTDAERAALYGLGIADVNKALASAIKPRFIDNYQGPESLVPIVFVNAGHTSVAAMLAATTVRNSEGHEYPLSIFVSVTSDEDFRFITASKKGQYYAVDIETDDPKRTLLELQHLTDQWVGHFEITYTGSYFTNKELMRQMATIFIVSVLLLYFILAAQFESLLQPLFILAELPIAVMGAIIFLYLGGNSLNLMAMIGIVVMAGLVINDSILKIDAINRSWRNGMPLLEAIHEGGLRRLKPMVMISLTSIGALAPTLFTRDLGSELQKPLSLALFGGMSVGLLVSLFFVPLIFWLVYRGREQVEDKKHRRHDDES